MQSIHFQGNAGKEQKSGAASSLVTLKDRCELEISGVDEVSSYDDRSIELIVCGVRTVIEGEDLKVTRLSTGDGIVCASGNICALIYDDGKTEKKGLFASLFGK